MVSFTFARSRISTAFCFFMDKERRLQKSFQAYQDARYKGRRPAPETSPVVIEQKPLSPKPSLPPELARTYTFDPSDEMPIPTRTKQSMVVSSEPLKVNGSINLGDKRLVWDSADIGVQTSGSGVNGGKGRR